MHERIAYTDERPDFLDDADCEVIERYNFGDGMGAALVRHDDEAHLTSLLDDDGRVRGHDPNFEVETQDIELEDDPKIATIEDVREQGRIATGEATGKGIRVGITDSGIDTSHPVFSGTTIKRVDVTGKGLGDTVGHGTGVAGQIVRLAPDVELVVIKIFAGNGRTSLRIIMRAYEELFKRADSLDLVNMSWGSSKKSQRLDDLTNRLTKKGVIPLVAAGNSGPKKGTAGSPATAEQSVSVGATTEAGEMANFSSWGPTHGVPDISLVGKGCRLAQASGTSMGRDLEGRFVKASGTSFSDPEVTGLAAKYLEANPDTTTSALRAALRDHAQDIKQTERDGAGIPDYRAMTGRTGDGEDGTDAPENPTTHADAGTHYGQSAVILGKPWLEGDYTAELVKQTDDVTTIKFR